MTPFHLLRAASIVGDVLWNAEMTGVTDGVDEHFEQNIYRIE